MNTTTYIAKGIQNLLYIGVLDISNIASVLDYLYYKARYSSTRNLLSL